MTKSVIAGLTGNPYDAVAEDLQADPLRSTLRSIGHPDGHRITFPGIFIIASRKQKKQQDGGGTYSVFHMIMGLDSHKFNIFFVSCRYENTDTSNRNTD
jgi:hypothetical protein